MYDQIPRHRQRRKDRLIGLKPAAHVKTGLGTEKIGGLVLQRAKFRVIAAQKPRSARPHRNPARQGFSHRLRQIRRGPQAKVIVRGEIKPPRRGQRPRPPAVGQPGKTRGMTGIPAHAASPQGRGASGRRPSLAKSRASALSSGFSAVKSVSPTKIEFAPAKKHIACNSSDIALRPAESRT